MAMSTAASILLNLPSMHSIISNTDAISAKGISFLTVVFVMVIGATKAAMPTISKVLKILDPMALPIAISEAPLSADKMLTLNSGIDVPNATTVSPITISDTPMREAIADAPSVSLSAPQTTMATPAIIPKMLNIIII